MKWIYVPIIDPDRVEAHEIVLILWFSVYMAKKGFNILLTLTFENNFFHFLFKQPLHLFEYLLYLLKY